MRVQRAGNSAWFLPFGDANQIRRPFIVACRQGGIGRFVQVV
jgi:hypothetical protein